MNDKPVHELPVPNYVERFDGAEIVAWQDVPEIYQKKILYGIMTDEDWAADWDVSNANPSKPIEDVVSDLLNASPVAKARHIHVWRSEYKTCMIKGCGHTRSPRVTYG